jgi:hypothetical protein
MGGRGGSAQKTIADTPVASTSQAGDQLARGTRGPISDSDLAVRVDGAIQHLESAPGEWVTLTRLRDYLGEDVNRHQLDRVLATMLLSGYNIVPESNQKALTQSGRDSAVRIGGQDKHLIVRERGVSHEPRKGQSTSID